MKITADVISSGNAPYGAILVTDGKGNTRWVEFKSDAVTPQNVPIPQAVPVPVTPPTVSTINVSYSVVHPVLARYMLPTAEWNNVHWSRWLQQYGAWHINPTDTETTAYFETKEAGIYYIGFSVAVIGSLHLNDSLIFNFPNASTNNYQTNYWLKSFTLQPGIQKLTIYAINARITSVWNPAVNKGSVAVVVYKGVSPILNTRAEQTLVWSTRQAITQPKDGSINLTLTLGNILIGDLSVTCDGILMTRTSGVSFTLNGVKTGTKVISIKNVISGKTATQSVVVGDGNTSIRSATLTFN